MIVVADTFSVYRVYIAWLDFGRLDLPRLIRKRSVSVETVIKWLIDLSETIELADRMVTPEITAQAIAVAMRLDGNDFRKRLRAIAG